MRRGWVVSLLHLSGEPKRSYPPGSSLPISARRCYQVARWCHARPLGLASKRCLSHRSASRPVDRSLGTFVNVLAHEDDCPRGNDQHEQDHKVDGGPIRVQYELLQGGESECLDAL